MHRSEVPKKMRKKKITYTKPRGITIKHGDFERLIGILDDGRRIFTKHVRESKHLFRKLDAWGIDAQVFTEQLLPIKATIRVIDAETGTTYQVGSSVFHEHGSFLHFKDGLNTHRAQIFLPRGYFMRIGGTPSKEGTGVQSQAELAAVDDAFNNF